LDIFVAVFHCYAFVNAVFAALTIVYNELLMRHAMPGVEEILIIISSL
jgi:hypothetical protein